MKRRSAFTLIELLVVIAIISIMAGILFPVLSRAKEAAKKSTCISNMRQLAVATLLYNDDSNYRFPFQDYGKSYWMFLISEYDGSLPDNIQHRTASIYVCPSDFYDRPQLLNDQQPVIPEPAETQWRLVASPDGKYRYWCTYAINEHLTDDWVWLSEWENLSNSFLYLESGGFNFDENEQDPEIEGDELDELRVSHNGGTNIAYLDTHAKWAKVVFNGELDSGRRSKGMRGQFRRWSFPPGGRGGPDGDTGPWTATADDDGG